MHLAGSYDDECRLRQSPVVKFDPLAYVGRLTVNVVPVSGWLVTSMLPW